MPARKLLLIVFAGALLIGPAASGSSAAETHEASNHTVTNPDDGTTIAITVFKPAGASAKSQVPVILHSHGWGGSRETEIGGVVQEFLDAGFGVVSIDQRGHGESTGEATVQDPTKETEDIKEVIDFVAELSWVKHDKNKKGKSKKGKIANDPVLGAIGGSYGGGYQTMTALDEIADEGRTRFNALAPEITWYDLPESLAPQKVVRSAWNVALYGVGAPMLPQYVHEAFVWGSASGQWPDGTVYGEKVDGIPDLDSEFHKHGPVAFVEKGVRIDVPVLLRQGTSDNLFNLNQGIDIFQKAVTGSARKSSYFVAYNGGHALPNALPPGTAAGEDSCSPEGFTQLTIDFFKKTFAGKSTKGLLPSRYNLTTAAGDNCLHLDELESSDPVEVVDPVGAGSVISTAGAGAPIHYSVAEGPITLAGVPTLSGKVTTTALDSRSFFGLSMGTTPADALVIQNNLMPLRKIMPVQDEEFKIELPGVAVEVPEGQSLFLTVSPISDMSFEHGSRVPGAVVLSDVELTLPQPPTGKGR
jgi:pimeloyl-ACP methyl ester carboxylesterase